MLGPKHIKKIQSLLCLQQWVQIGYQVFNACDIKVVLSQKNSRKSVGVSNKERELIQWRQNAEGSPKPIKTFNSCTN